MALPASDVLYALDNTKLRSFIPSVDNTFGGFRARYVMIDSGCNSHLLAIEAGGLPALFALFPTNAPTAAGETFTYTIRGGGGVAALQAPVLCVSNNGGNAFRVRLSGDLHPHEFTHTDYLRFSVCYDDAAAILAAFDAGAILLVGDQSLRGFVTAVDTLRTALPTVVVGGRRRHALLGRSIIGVAGRQMRFTNGLTIITANQARLYADAASVAATLNTCVNAVAANPGMGLPLFNNLEDDYMSEGPRDEEKQDA